MKVGLAGTGWRAQMYVRVMKALGEEFEVSAVYVHSESSREREEKNFPGKVYTDYDEFLATKPDCVVFMLKYGAALPFAEKAMEQGIPVLCETPPAATVITGLVSGKRKIQRKSTGGRTVLLPALLSGTDPYDRPG